MIANNIYSIVLLSASARRKALVKQMGFEVKVKPTNLQETYPSALIYDRIPEYLSVKKANSFPLSHLKDNEILLAADTMVFQNEKPLFKPQTTDQAIFHLQSLSNGIHTVITGCTLKSRTKTISFSDTTTVVFNPLTVEEINYYVNKYSPYDKAGGYGIQEWIGLIGIKEINGSPYNVMGLPTHQVYQKIKTL